MPIVVGNILILITHQLTQYIYIELLLYIEYKRGGDGGTRYILYISIYFSRAYEPRRETPWKLRHSKKTAQPIL